MPEPIHERYQCEGFYGFGIGVELAEPGQHAPGAPAYCNRCPNAGRCWFRHRGRVMWLFPDIAATTIAAMNEHRADDPEAPPGEAILENDPFMPIMIGNIEDGALTATRQQPKDRGPFSIHLDEHRRPKPSLGDVDWSSDA